MCVEGSKFCHNINREHKSNHIYLVCNLSKGFIVQRCYDPDCRNFQSEPVKIPENILEGLRKQYLTDTMINNLTPTIPKPKNDFTKFLEDFSDEYESQNNNLLFSVS